MKSSPSNFASGFWKGAGLAAGVAVCGAALLMAQSLTKFQPGQVVSASALNANFAALETRIASAENTIAIMATGIAPVGTILAWHRDLGGVPGLPAGWVECDGGLLNDPQSPLNGMTIPDLNGGGRFLRGAATSGVSQDDTFQGHHHFMFKEPQLVELIATPPMGSFGVPLGTQDISRVGVSITGYQARQAIPDGIHGIPRVSGETRPSNMSVVWIMRVR